MTPQQQLNAHRIKQDKSVTWVSKQSGIGQHIVKAVMSGGNCTVKTLVKIAGVLGVEVTFKIK